MCNTWCLDFVRRCTEPMIFDKADPFRNVVECGSLNVNGSPRNSLFHPSWRYTGIDIQGGPGVDMVLSVYDLDIAFGAETVDIVVSTEMLEHVIDWRLALRKMATVLKVGGVLILTTCCPGVEYHPYPFDCWRFTMEHMREIFVDPMRLEMVEYNNTLCNGNPRGVGVLARRTPEPAMKDWMLHLNAVEACKP